MTTADRIRAERAAQGLPPSVEDAGALRVLAGLIAGKQYSRGATRLQRKRESNRGKDGASAAE